MPPAPDTLTKTDDRRHRNHDEIVDHGDIIVAPPAYYREEPDVENLLTHSPLSGIIER